MCSRSLPLTCAPEPPDGCLDLLGEGRAPLRRPPWSCFSPPSSPFLAVSLNSCKLTLALRPPPDGPATAFEVDGGPGKTPLVPGACEERGSELIPESRVPRDDPEGRSKMELPTEEAAASDETGEMLRGVLGNGESGAGSSR